MLTVLGDVLGGKLHIKHQVHGDQIGKIVNSVSYCQPFKSKEASEYARQDVELRAEPLFAEYVWKTHCSTYQHVGIEPATNLQHVADQLPRDQVAHLMKIVRK